MDPVSQTVLGAAVGAVFRPRLGGKAVAVGALCGAFPDIDVVAGYLDEWAMLVHHRGATHSLLVLTLAAPAFGWLGYRWSDRTAYWTWTHLAFWALVTHTLLDWCTPYGTQLLWPLTDRRFAIDAVAVIDPLYTLPLLIALLVNLLPKISAQRAARVAIAALLLSTGYLMLGYIQSQRALALSVPQIRGQGVEPVEVRALPTLFNIWLWRIVARDDDGRLLVGHVSTWSPRPLRLHRLERPESSLLNAALASRQGQIFDWFAMGMISASIEQQEDGATVILSDQRYGLISQPTASPFRARARFDANGKLLNIDRLRRANNVDVRAELKLLWRLIQGDDGPQRNLGPAS